MIRRMTTSEVLKDITTPQVSEALSVEDCRNLVLEAYLVGATGTFKAKVSNVEAINFSIPSTSDNPWYYVDLKGLGDGATTVQGSTGITTSVESTQKAYAINVDMARYVAIDAEVLSAGSATFRISRATNE